MMSEGGNSSTDSAGEPAQASTRVSMPTLCRDVRSFKLPPSPAEHNDGTAASSCGVVTGSLSRTGTAASDVHGPNFLTTWAGLVESEDPVPNPSGRVGELTLADSAGTPEDFGAATSLAALSSAARAPQFAYSSSAGCTPGTPSAALACDLRGRADNSGTLAPAQHAAAPAMPPSAQVALPHPITTAPAQQTPLPTTLAQPGASAAMAILPRPKRLNRLYLGPAAAQAHRATARSEPPIPAGPMWRTRAAVSSGRASIDAVSFPGAASGLGPHAAMAVQRIAPAALLLAASASGSGGLPAAAAAHHHHHHTTTHSGSESVRGCCGIAGQAAPGSHADAGEFASEGVSSSHAAPVAAAAHQRVSEPKFAVAAFTPAQAQGCGGTGGPAAPFIMSSGGLGLVARSPMDGGPGGGGGGKSPCGSRSPRAASGPRQRASRQAIGCEDGFTGDSVVGDDGCSDAGCGELDGATHIAKRAASHTSAHGYHIAFAPGTAAASAVSDAATRSRPVSGYGSAMTSCAFDTGAAQAPDAAAAAAAARVGSSRVAPAAPSTCRLSMKLHSGHVEQIQPGAVAALARLLLPSGWALTNLAVRRGCIELVLEYTRVPAADESSGRGDAGDTGGGGNAAAAGGSGTAGEATGAAAGGGGGSGAAEERPGTPRAGTQTLAAAALAAALGVPLQSHPQPQPQPQQEGDLPAHQLEALFACLQQQGLVDPTLEPAVTVQVNHQLQCVRWQPGPGAATAAGPTSTEDSDSLHPQSPFALAATETDPHGAAAHPAAGGEWRCDDVPVYCGAPSIALVVEPCCIALPCTTAPATAASASAAAAATGGSGNGSDAVARARFSSARTGGGGRGYGEAEGEVEAVLLYVGIPRSGTHCCTVRSQGGFLPATEVCRLPALDLLPAASTGSGARARGARVNLPQMLTLASTPAAAVAAPPATAPQPVPTVAATGLLLRRLVVGVAAPAQAARVDLRCAAAVAEAVGCSGQVVVLSLPAAALPHSGGSGTGALLQVECRVPSEECTWSSALEEDLAGSGNSGSAAPQPATSGASGAAPAAVAGDVAPVADGSGPSGGNSGSLLPRTSDPFSAAAPVLLLRAACCGAAAGRGAGGHCAGCQHRAAVNAGARATVPWASAWTPDEVMGVTQEILELRRRFTLGVASALSSSSSSGGVGLGGAGLTPAAAGAATVEFLSDLGLLLDAAAAATAAAVDAVAGPGGGGGSGGSVAAAHEYEFPSFAAQLRGVMLEHLGGAAGAATPTSALREHLGDTVVTLLAGCGELRLPRMTRLVLALAAALDLVGEGDGAADDGGVAELLAAAADGDAALAARLRALLQLREAPPLPEVLQPRLSYASPAVSSSSSSARMRMSGGMPHSGGAVSATALDPAAAVAALAGLPLPARPSSRAALRFDQDHFYSHLHAHLQPLLQSQPQPQASVLPQPQEVRGWGELVTRTSTCGDSGTAPVGEAPALPSADVYAQISSHQLLHPPPYTAALQAAEPVAAHGTATPVTPAVPDAGYIPACGSDSGNAYDTAAVSGQPPTIVYQRFRDPFLARSAYGGAFSAFRVAITDPQHEHAREREREPLDSDSNAVGNGAGGGASGSVEVLSGGAGVMVGGGPRPVPQRVAESPRAPGAVGEVATATLMPAPSLVSCSLSAAASLEMGKEGGAQQQQQQQQTREAQEADQEQGAPHCCRLVAAIAAVCAGRRTRAGLSLNGAVPLSASAALPSMQSTGAPEQPGTPIPDPTPPRQRHPTDDLAAAGSSVPSCDVSTASTSRLLAAASCTLSASAGTHAASVTSTTGTVSAAAAREGAPAELPPAAPFARWAPHVLARALLLGFPCATTELQFWDHATATFIRPAFAACATLLALTTLLAALHAVAGGGLAGVVMAVCHGGQAALMAAAVARGSSAKQFQVAVVLAALLRAVCGVALVCWVAGSGAAALSVTLLPGWGSPLLWTLECLAQPAAEQLPLRLLLPLMLLLGPWAASLLGATTWMDALRCVAAKFTVSLGVQVLLRARYLAAAAYHQKAE